MLAIETMFMIPCKMFVDLLLEYEDVHYHNIYDYNNVNVYNNRFIIKNM